jgi:hypothetical protein
MTQIEKKLYGVLSGIGFSRVPNEPVGNLQTGVTNAMTSLIKPKNELTTYSPNELLVVPIEVFFGSSVLHLI